MNENVSSRLLELVKKNECAVIGLGISNLPLIDVLLSLGASVVAYDKKSESELLGVATDLKNKGVRLILGENYLDKVPQKVIFRSPGIRPDLPAFAEAEKNGAVITSEMEFFFELCPSKIYAVTGSDGKTTTTTLTHIFLREQKKRENKRAYLGGNIGAPLLPFAFEMNADDVSVVELSSFQLMGGGCTPHAAAITNITPNHLNWHTDMDEYVRAKMAICSHKTKRLVLNSDNETTRLLNFGKDVTHVFFSSEKIGIDEVVPSGIENGEAVYVRDGYIVYCDRNGEKQVLPTDDIKLPGRHNLENYMTAIALTYGEVDVDIYRETAQCFGGVEHRLEFVAEVGGVKYYNSSIDSSPTRTAAALSALKEKPIVICGGADKNIPFEPLADVLCKRAKAVILNGMAAPKIKAALDGNEGLSTSGLRVYEESDLASAIETAVRIAGNGDTVLLSPACTSFDQFKNFEHRGKFFKDAVLRMLTNK